MFVICSKCFQPIKVKKITKYITCPCCGDRSTESEDKNFSRRYKQYLIRREKQCAREHPDMAKRIDKIYKSALGKSSDKKFIEALNLVIKLAKDSVLSTNNRLVYTEYVDTLLTWK